MLLSHPSLADFGDHGYRRIIKGGAIEHLALPVAKRSRSSGSGAVPAVKDMSEEEEMVCDIVPMASESHKELRSSRTGAKVMIR